MGSGATARGKNDCAAGLSARRDPPRASGHPSWADCCSDFFRGIESAVVLDELVVDWVMTTDVRWVSGNNDPVRREGDGDIFKSALARRRLHGRVTEIARIALAGMVGVFHRQICPNCRVLDAARGFLAHEASFRGVTDRSGSTVFRGRFDKTGVHRHERDVRA